MVCQAASQTRFRALKHENGITGRATIRVRVIACFQPLQNCQVRSIFLPHLWIITVIFNCCFSVVGFYDVIEKLPNLQSVFAYQAEYFRQLLKPVT